ncbi:hypothetical protein KP509_18G017700 [Ceratopteris richardii]|uniref:Uncharacterized protein n=1 Tax=Ceratopteris richardii TaxID=49495 RepID=A0A8T2SSB4_CERRI|nr:hypothetical protein KP509_18G017700 [Ceratopteris richardii]
MATRIVVLPVAGRRWAFCMTKIPTNSSPSQPTRESFLQVWLNACLDLKSGRGFAQSFSPVTHYVSEKMEQKWTALEAAEQGSMKNRVYQLGQKLLARISPSESFLKLFHKDIPKLEIVYPVSLNSRLVRRRVRHVAKCGARVHSRYMYGSFACLPFSVLFGIVPVPNIPLFWNLFRAYANWQALQGSRRLLEFVSDGSDPLSSRNESGEKDKNLDNAIQPSLVLSPSKRLESMLQNSLKSCEEVSDPVIVRICEMYDMDNSQVLKWRDFKR